MIYKNNMYRPTNFKRRIIDSVFLCFIAFDSVICALECVLEAMTLCYFSFRFPNLYDLMEKIFGEGDYYGDTK